MARTFLSLTLILLSLFSLKPGKSPGQDVQILDLGGKWKFRKAGTVDWMDARVPGCVHLDLMSNHRIPDPFYRDNESKLQWIGEIGWEYKRDFTVRDTLLRKPHVELVCKGLDTYANVYINDSLVIVADNMFRDWYADIRRYLRPGENTIRIRFPAIVQENRVRYAQLGYKLPGDDKVVCRKAAYHFGWDWGPTFITSGIWRPIYIRTWDYLNLLGVQYIQNKVTDTVADLTAVFTVLSTVEDTCDIRIRNGPHILAKFPYPVKKGVNYIRVNFFIPYPQRWWPNGLGEPHLYTFTHEIVMGRRYRVTGTTRLGLRKLELVQTPDSIGRSFYFRVNGVPVFMKGANYIPQDNFLPRVKDSSYRALIREAAEAHMNMLRVWGGGIYENDLFYDLCDENGILVWQDFMFACALYPDDMEFSQNVRMEAVQNVVRLRNHACLALWCGNNEIDEGWKNWGWQKQYGYTPDDSIRIWRSYLSLFQNLLYRVVVTYDSLTPYISTSPRYGWGRPESTRVGDMHYWGVWWGKEPFAAYRSRVGRFMSEYGFQGFPSLSTIDKFTLPEDRKLGSPVMKAHQKHPVGYETIDEYLLRDFRKPKDFDSYVYVSQLLQAEGIGTAIEAHRRAKPVCMGTLYWQLNDCWPVVSWSSLDWYGQPKALYYEVKKLYATVLVSPVADSGHLKVWVVSDSLSPVSGTLHLRLVDFSGETLWTKDQDILVPANSSEIYLDSLLVIHDPSRTCLSVSLTSDQKTLATKTLYFAPDKDLRLPVPDVTKKIAETPTGYKVEIHAGKLARAVYLSTTLPGRFSDNYFDLLPGETRVVYFQTHSHSPDFPQLLKIRDLSDTY